jgi:hypothetical protein
MRKRIGVPFRAEYVSATVLGRLASGHHAHCILFGLRFLLVTNCRRRAFSNCLERVAAANLLKSDSGSLLSSFCTSTVKAYLNTVRV